MAIVNGSSNSGGGGNSDDSYEKAVQSVGKFKQRRGGVPQLTSPRG